MYGSARYGASRWGGALIHLTNPAPPDPPPVLPWTPTAPTPVTPPSATPTVPEVQFELVDRDGTHVAWLDEESIGQEWRRDAKGPGMVSVALRKSSALAVQMRYPRMLRVRYRGKVVQDGLIGARKEATYQPGKEDAQRVSVRAPGHLSITEGGTCGPHSLTSKPTVLTQRFFYGHQAYKPGPEWVPATVLVRQDGTSEHWTHTPPKWSAFTANWISAAGDTTDNAAAGDLYVIRDRTVPGQTHLLDFTADDSVDQHVDGMLVGTAIDFHGFESRVLPFSEGKHRFAARWGNIAQALDNPTGYLAALRLLDAAGRAGDPTWVSDASCLLLARPATPPGWTVGQIVNYLLDLWESRGGRRIYRGFSDLLDTAGNAWPVLPDWSISSKASIWQALSALIETYCEASMRPGSFTLDLWVKGMRGTTRTEQFGSGYNGVALPCIVSLDHEVQAPYATTIHAVLGAEWIERSVWDPASGEDNIVKTLDLPNQLTPAQAEDILDQLLAIFGRERIQYRAVIHPRNDAQRPHFGFDEGDTIPLPDPDGVFTDVEVLSIIGAKVGKRHVRFTIEAGDLLLNDEEMVHAWLRQKAEGAFGGSTHQSTSTLTERPPLHTQPTPRPLRFHRPIDAENADSGAETAEESGSIVEFAVTLDVVAVAERVVNLKVDGTIVATVTIPIGAQWGSVRVNVPVSKGVEIIRAHCATLEFEFTAKAVME